MATVPAHCHEDHVLREAVASGWIAAWRGDLRGFAQPSATRWPKSPIRGMSPSGERGALVECDLRTVTRVPRRVGERSGFAIASAQQPVVPFSTLAAPNDTNRCRMEEQIKAAIIDELKRQAEISRELDVRQEGDRLAVDGPIDVDALVMVVVGSIAGGP